MNQKIYLVQTTEDEEIVPPVFSNLEAATTYVTKSMKLLEKVGDFKKDASSTSEFTISTTPGVGRQWEILYNHHVHFWITEISLHDSCDHPEFRHLNDIEV